MPSRLGTIQIRHTSKKKANVVAMVDIPYLAQEMKIIITPLVIQNPTPFHYESEKAFPWRYELKVYKQGNENQPLVISDPNVTSIVKPGGMTQSGRVFAQRTIEPLAKAKGEEVRNYTSTPAQNIESQGGSSCLKVVASQKNVEEFLRIIKKSDYRVVD